MNEGLFPINVGHGDLSQRQGVRCHRPADPAGAHAEQEGDRGRDGQSAPWRACRSDGQRDHLLLFGCHRLPEQDPLRKTGWYVHFQSAAHLALELLHLVQMLAIGR